MIKQQELKGEWKLPGKQDGVNGILTFDPLNGAKLEIFGTFESGYQMSPEIILGKTTEGWVTLMDSNYQSGHHSNVTSTGVSTYKPMIILKGYQFDSKDDINFTSVHFTVFNLLEWIGIDAIQLESKENNHLLEYKRPDDIIFNCYPGCIGKIRFKLEGQFANRQYQMELSQHCEVILNYDQIKSYQDILHDVFTFLGVITFCTYEQTYPMEIVFLNEQFKDEFATKSLKRDITQPITCIYRNSYYSPNYKRRDTHQHLVKYQSISGRFSDIIAAWFTQSKDLDPVLQLVLRSFIDKYNFSTEKFMDSIRAIETFHRLKHNNEVVSKEEIKQILDTIAGTDLSENQKKLIKDKLNFAHEPSLKQRLEEMIRFYTFSYFEKRVSDKNIFTKNARDSRNYYTHFDKSLEKKALKHKPLFDLTENINLLLFSAILKSIGVPEDAYDQSARYLIYS